MPAQDAVAELYQLTALETTLEKLTETSDFFKEGDSRLRKLPLRRIFTKRQGFRLEVMRQRALQFPGNGE
ncbi:MAG: hypothetical protein K2N73_16385 [Lachnospiraceae bacterium]|nr:hypothetical protein [Lachnospiraceae bacterium]